jgi:hypothetical protein
MSELRIKPKITRHLHLKKCEYQTFDCFKMLYGCCCGCINHPSNKKMEFDF